MKQKRISGIEESEEQCDALNGLEKDLAEFVLEQAIKPQTASRDELKLEDMLTAYLTGNISNIVDIFESNVSSGLDLTEEEQALMARFQSYMKRNLFTLRDEKMA